MMTEQKIYELAWSQQITIWGKEKEVLDRHPDNEVSIARERQAWARLKEIEEMMVAKGYK